MYYYLQVFGRNNKTSYNSVYEVRSFPKDLTQICLRYATANIAYAGTLFAIPLRSILTHVREQTHCFPRVASRHFV
jgi:hypothetical protein